MRVARIDARIAGSVLAFVVLASLAGCESAPPRARAVAPAPAPAPAPVEPPLAPSTVVAHGVVLPEGLEPAYETGGTKAYKSDVRARRVLAYFAERYPSPHGLERIGQGGVLRGVPVEVDGAPRHVTVAVLGRSNGGARVQIDLLARPTDDPRSPEERRRAFIEHVRNGE